MYSRQMELEEDQLDDDLSTGKITQEEYNKEIKEMRRSYQAEAEEAAKYAYIDELNNWY